MAKRRRRQKVNKQILEAKIENLSHEGRGIANIEGKTVFVRGALPGETVTFQYTKYSSKYSAGLVCEVKEKNTALRATPACPHYLTCGGCSTQHMSEQAQLDYKQKTLLEQLQHFAKLEPDEVLPPLVANNWHYRRKARLGVRYVSKKGKVLVGFREIHGRFVADCKQCEILHPSVANLFPTLSELVRSLNCYNQVPQIEIAIGDDHPALIFRHLEKFTQDDLTKLRNFAQLNKIHVYLQPQGIDSINKLWPDDGYLRLRYALPEYNINMLFHPADFTQVNAEMNQKMIAQAIQYLQPQPEDKILDLFCGLGNFSLPLAKHCQKVIGIEGDKNSVLRAEENARFNKITNTEFYSMDLEKDFSQQAWAKQKFDKILLDPARTGALNVVQQIQQFSASIIVYISCNPATLARDSAHIAGQGYHLVKAGIMNMFPHTSHVESIAVFVKK